jgi:hypothetical protein
MATLPKVLINRADYQIGGGVALRLRTQGWHDKDNGETSDGYSRLPLDQLVETLAQQAKALGLHIDLSYKFHDPGRFGGTVEPKLIEGVVKGSEEKKR